MTESHVKETLIYFLARMTEENPIILGFPLSRA
jgi:hypothetical protein